jgi:hypothetical protein
VFNVDLALCKLNAFRKLQPTPVHNKQLEVCTLSSLSRSFAEFMAFRCVDASWAEGLGCNSGSTDLQQGGEC